MSKKWKTVATNALESFNLEYIMEDPKEKEKIRQKRRMEAFKLGMKIDRMKIEKTKRHYEKDDNADID